MVSRSKKEPAGKKKRIKVLNLNKETVKNLTRDEAESIKGGTGVCLSGRASARSIVSSIGQSLSGGIVPSVGQGTTSFRGSF